MSPSKENVLLFLNKFGGNSDDEDCVYNVMPSEITEKYGFEVFKQSSDYTGETYLVYNDRLYVLGDHGGGLGVTAFAVADINGDGAAELYFTYSRGPGANRSTPDRSKAGYFDPAAESITYFDFFNTESEMVFGTDDGKLGLYIAAAVPGSAFTFVFMDLEPCEKLGEIVCESGEITLKTVE
ncbi:hypothetical protein [Ruminococcus sp.]|uniref:hypothetical protein n=1 Tax=Ruminococcus sp. TaxID=41978 RepID=UPI0025F2E614|nr:hypothetical protein [Ruminococcus sp.]